MEKVLPNDEEVLIFKVSNNTKENDYIKGKIISSRESNDLSHHSSSSWYETIYDVRGEDGHLYTGTYNRDYIDKYVFFRTTEDHIKYLQEKINRNYRKIYELNSENETYNETIKNLKQEQSKAKEKTKKRTIF